jgi:hypothetical protein
MKPASSLFCVGVRKWEYHCSVLPRVLPAIQALLAQKIQLERHEP